MEDLHALLPKPLYRGILHKYAFFASIPCALFLCLFSPSPIVFWPMLIYGISLMGLFGVSALYHRRNWSPKNAKKMGKIDRTMIYFFIAGNYTPFGVLAMDGVLPDVLLITLWTAVLFGAIINFFWYAAPNWIHSILYLVVSWVCVLAVPQLRDNLGYTCLIWMLSGGILHSIGAIIYAMRSPNPFPKRFGFHEIFHCFVTLAIAIHYGVVAHYLLIPRLA
jgi:hemolysin III